MSTTEAVTLLGGTYVRLGQPADDALHAGEVTRMLGELVGVQAARLLAELNLERAGRHYLCSTILDIPLASGLVDWPRLAAAVEQRAPGAPASLFLNAYECASWGYALRHALHVPIPDGRPLLVSIVDVNVLGLSHWQANKHWGESGFGVATLALDARTLSEAALNIGVAKTGNAVAEFAMAMRQHCGQASAVSLAKPFFPRGVTDLFERTIPAHQQLRDLHPRFGHCFGADPWIAIFDALAAPADAALLQSNGSCEARSKGLYAAASVALSGYWAIANIDTSRTRVHRIEDLRHGCLQH